MLANIVIRSTYCKAMITKLTSNQDRHLLQLDYAHLKKAQADQQQQAEPPLTIYGPGKVEVVVNRKFLLIIQLQQQFQIIVRHETFLFCPD